MRSIFAKCWRYNCCTYSQKYLLFLFLFSFGFPPENKSQNKVSIASVCVQIGERNIADWTFICSLNYSEEGGNVELRTKFAGIFYAMSLKNEMFLNFSRLKACTFEKNADSFGNMQTICVSVTKGRFHKSKPDICAVECSFVW